MGPSFCAAWAQTCLPTCFVGNGQSWVVWSAPEHKPRTKAQVSGRAAYSGTQMYSCLAGAWARESVSLILRRLGAGLPLKSHRGHFPEVRHQGTNERDFGGEATPQRP